MNGKKEPDYKLVKALVASLVKANETDYEEMWEFAGIAVGQAMSEKYLLIIRRVIREIGKEVINVAVVIFDKEMQFITLREKNFEQFVNIVNAYVDEHVVDEVDYKEAFDLLTALANLCDHRDVTCSVSFNDTRLSKHVRITPSFCVLLGKIISKAGLEEEMIKSGLCHKSLRDDLSVIATIPIDKLCAQLETIEDIIRSIVNNWEKFTFDIGMIDDSGNSRKEMTLGEFCQYEYEDSIK